MATPTIPNGEEYFFPIIYEGNGAGQRVGKFVPFTDNGTIDNSCIFNDGDSAYLSRTPSSAGNRRTFTLSCWVKRGNLPATYTSILGTVVDYNSLYSTVVGFNSSQQLVFIEGATNFRITNRTFEDTSKFYHILVSVDTTQSTASDRIKIYIDGEQVTSFGTSNNPSLNAEFQFNNTVAQGVGCDITASSGARHFFDGYIAEVNVVDGQALTPASFGLTDTSTGRWIPSVVKPYPTTTTTFTVTVADASGNKYFIDSSQQATVTLIEGATYRFDQSDSSNAGHPLRFSTTSNGTHSSGVEFTSGVTTVGTPGSSGAYTEITVPTGTATLYYYCTNHSGMGGTANTQDQYGVNGFRLEFGTSSALGDDTSGNTNDFTATNLASTDQTTDSPTQNHFTLDPNKTGTGNTLSEGNLKIVTSTSNNNSGFNSGKLIGNSGKYYFEAVDTNSTTWGIGINAIANVTSSGTTPDVSEAYLFLKSGTVSINGTTTASQYTAWSDGATLGIAIDMDNKQIKLYVNNTLTYTISNIVVRGREYFIMGRDYSGSGSQTITFNFGQKSFTYTPPTGFSSLQQDNLPETAKGVSSFVWIKSRDSAYNHISFDSSQGVNVRLLPSATNSAVTAQDTLNKFLKGGFQTGSNSTMNNAGDSFVSWNWVANGGTTETIDTGGDVTIATSVQKNTTAGFSICRFTAPSSAGKFAHGLSQAPEWIIGKDLGRTTGWFVYHKDVGTGKLFYLNSNSAPSSNATVYSTAPTATVVDAGTGLTSGSSYGEQVYYCWHGVDGFSKFSSYTGNGSSDGTFVATNFSPSFVMVKRTNTTGNWIMWDTKRDAINPMYHRLYANLTNTQGTSGADIDFLSNGFKIRRTGNDMNASGSTYVYMAFAEHPFVGDGTSPVTAR